MSDIDEPRRRVEAATGEGDEGADSEGSGDVIMGEGAADDSSEEEESDPEEVQRVRQGFIVDEDEDDEDGDVEDEDVRKHKKRRKRRKKHLRSADDEELEEDDLELLAENTGQRKLTRISRRRSESPPRRERGGDKALDAIWSDEEQPREEYASDEDDLHRFIASDSDDDPDRTEEEKRQAAEEKRKQREEIKDRRRRGLINPGIAGIDPGEWDDIVDVFGTGSDYEWALELDEDGKAAVEVPKDSLRLQDVFEPSEIRDRLLTEDDDLIRSQDIPERMQLLTSSLSASATVVTQEAFRMDDLNDAADWVVTRLGDHIIKKFFEYGAQHEKWKSQLVLAVRTALDALLVQTLEVPYIWAHRRDQLSVFDMPRRIELLSNDDLWKVYQLGMKFRAFLDRKRGLDTLYERLALGDPYFDNHIKPALQSVESVADATEWIGFKYKDRKDDSLVFHDDIPSERKHKAPSRVSEYELVKKSVVARLAQGYGMNPEHVVVNFKSGTRLHIVEDQDVAPLDFALQFADPASGVGSDPKALLAKARMLIATELGKDPLLREETRNQFQTSAVLTVLPTDKGISKISEYHPYNAFKYLKDKPLSDRMLTEPQYLHILKAESELLVTVDIHLQPEAIEQWSNSFYEAVLSEDDNEVVRAWNDERRLVIKEVLETTLLPLGAKWMKEWAREQAEDYLAKAAATRLHERVNMVGFRARKSGLPTFANPRDLPDPDTTPAVLAVSWGDGHPQRDVITMVFIDRSGRLRDQLTVPNLYDEKARSDFMELVRRRKPESIVVGGYSIHTTKLWHRIKDLLKQESGMGDDEAMQMGPSDNSNGGGGPSWVAPSTEDAPWQSWEMPHWSEPGMGDADDSDRWLSKLPIVYVKDDVARIYQSSQRAADEFSALSPLAKYCVGLARYAQSPLMEFCALGGDLGAITFDEDAQQVVPKEKLLIALERALVNVVNSVGVDINRAVSDPYYFHLLPFVAGLGPRKAQHLKKKIDAIGGTLVNREQIVKVTTLQIWMNAAGFLRIQQDRYSRDNKRNKRREEVSDQQDPLDQTRIHPEDYELARKMAMDALEFDEEDTRDEHPSHVIGVIIDDENKETKLNELSLDDFAMNLIETNQDNKRHTLDVIKQELMHPFYDSRPEFKLPSFWEIVTMLSSETPKTLRPGLIVSVSVTRIKDQFIDVRLASGVDGFINISQLTDFAVSAGDANKFFSKGQTMAAVIVNLKQDRIGHVELTARPSDIALGDSQFRRVMPDQIYTDIQRATRDQEMLARKKRHETGDNRRVIKHPNFHNFNARQAEDYLATRSRGDIIIRPSSKGKNHLAVTWKVDDSLYQHIDVTEVDGDGSQTVAGRLLVEGGFEYSDLDELIVNHVKAMARRVDELMAHEKFKAGTTEDIERHLRDYVNAYPTRSIYAFALNRQKPGHFNIVFLANKNSNTVSWPVKVAPSYYALFDTSVPSVPQLTDAFKMRHLHETTKFAAGGKTPYGAGVMTPGGSRTPGGGRTPGHMTPGRSSIRQVARTPNPYAAAPGQVPAPPAPGVFASGSANGGNTYGSR